jgi:DNA-binding NarL/FixJ family response regulator
VPTTSSDAAAPRSVHDRHFLSAGAADGIITVAVLTDDPLAASGAQSYLSPADGIRLATEGQASAADVVMVITAVVTDQLLDRMRRVREASTVPHQCMLLICAHLTERRMALAFRYGVVSMVPRETATRESIVSAVLASGRGSAELSGPATRWIVDTSREFQEIAQAAHGITPGGLTTREADVVRLIAEGLSTNEIAGRMNYAERTIKNIIREMLDRHKLRNRAHAVAYAHRTGAI